MVFEAPRRREIVSPEGVPLVFQVAPGGSRAMAFLLDLLIILAGLVILAVGLSAAASGAGGYVGALILIGWFFGVNFYFPLFELTSRGATPGKRALGIRVIDRHGRPLDAGAVIARNFMRDLELWFPLQVLVLVWLLGIQHPLAAGIPSQLFPLFAIWIVIVLFFPLFNRDRLRIGDLVGGTMVVSAPRVRLLSDQASKGEDVDGFNFTREQLDIYGIYELQVLEDLLRQGSRRNRETTRLVYEKVVNKIGWRPPPGDVDHDRFLAAFYKAQRARLEQKMMLGKRQERKVDGVTQSKTSAI